MNDAVPKATATPITNLFKEVLKVYPKDILRKSEYASGYDLEAKEDVDIPKNRVVMVRTGTHVEIPTGYVGLLFLRSSMGVKRHFALANAVGVIDSDYRGEILVALRNVAPSAFEKCEIKKGDRIAQLILVPAFTPQTEVVESLEDLSSTERGQGGFGSTGT